MWLCFVRHGQTDDNVQGIIQGHKDTPLNDHGRHESRRLGRRLKRMKFTKAYTSPLSRARETAEIVLERHPGLTLHTPVQLIERGLGSLEGRRRLKGEHAPPDAETYESMAARQTEWFDSLLAAHEPPDPLPNHSSILTRIVSSSSSRHRVQMPHHGSDHSSGSGREQIILVCSHGAWLHTFASLLLSNRYKFSLASGVDPRTPCFNTSVMLVRCEWRNGRWKGQICSWGDVEHLDDMMSEEVAEVADDVR